MKMPDRQTKKEARRDFLRPNRYALDMDPILRDGKTHPVALILPGGGYAMVCSFIEGRPLARRLNEMGVSAVIVYYRLRGRARFPAPVEDVARAVRELTARADELNIDMEHYSLWGASAGAHAAALFAAESCGWTRYGVKKPSALVLSYPVISMEEGLSHAGSRRNLLGKAPAAEQVRAASADQQVTGSYPPTFLWCGDADKLVSAENSRRMDDALSRNNVPHEFHLYPHVEHGVGLGIGTACEGWEKQAVRFWEERV